MLAEFDFPSNRNPVLLTVGMYANTTLSVLVTWVAFSSPNGVAAVPNPDAPAEATSNGVLTATDAKLESAVFAPLLAGVAQAHADPFHAST